METICMKCQILFSGEKMKIGDNLPEISNIFSGKNKKNIISLLSAALAQKLVTVKLLCSFESFKGKKLMNIILIQHQHSKAISFLNWCESMKHLGTCCFSLETKQDYQQILTFEGEKKNDPICISTSKQFQVFLPLQVFSFAEIFFLTLIPWLLENQN